MEQNHIVRGPSSKLDDATLWLAGLYTRVLDVAKSHMNSHLIKQDLKISFHCAHSDNSNMLLLAFRLQRLSFTNMD